MKCYKGELFIAPASYFIENLEGQGRENFETWVFQYDGMVCGMVEEINYEYNRFLASFKAPDESYAIPIVTLSVDCNEVDWSKLHSVKSIHEIDVYHFLMIKEQDIIDIIKNKDYD